MWLAEGRTSQHLTALVTYGRPAPFQHAHQSTIIFKNCMMCSAFRSRCPRTATQLSMIMCSSSGTQALSPLTLTEKEERRHRNGSHGMPRAAYYFICNNCAAVLWVCVRVPEGKNQAPNWHAYCTLYPASSRIPRKSLTSDT